MQDAIFCKNSKDGFTFPFSKREIFACAVPILSANSFWVKPASLRVMTAARIASYSGPSR